MSQIDLLKTARNYELQGQLDNAIEVYKEVLEKEPKSAVTHVLLGNVYCGKVWQNFEYYWLVMAANEIKQAGEIYLEAENFEQAGKAFSKALELKENDAECYFKLGCIYHHFKDLNKAKTYYEAAISLNPRNPRYHNNLGVAYREEQSTEEAIKCYKRALEIDPSEKKALFNLGCALLRQDDLKEAIRVYTELAKLEPNDSLTQYNLAQAYYRIGKTRSAAECAVRARELGLTGDEVSRFLNLLGVQVEVKSESHDTSC